MQLFSEDATMFFKKINIFFAPENMKKPPSKVAHNRLRPFFQYCQTAQIKPKSQFLFHENLPPWDFSIMTLPVVCPGAWRRTSDAQEEGREKHCRLPLHL